MNKSAIRVIKMMWHRLPARIRYNVWRLIARVLRTGHLTFDRFVDWRYGIDTTLDRGFSDREKTLTAFRDPTRSMSTSYWALLRLRRRLKVNARDIFLDLGCGSGRALFVFARSKANLCIGVEFDPVSLEKAYSNLDTFRYDGSKIRLISRDASSYDFNNETIIFLFNPFGEETLKSVINKITENTTPSSDVRLVYHNPIYGSEIENVGKFHLVDSFYTFNCKTFIYRMNG